MLKTFFICLIVLPLSTQAANTLKIMVSIAPQKFIVDAIGGHFIDVDIMLPSGQSPTTFSPSPLQMMKLSEYDAYFQISVPFEQTWTQRIKKINPRLLFINAQKGINLRSIEHHQHDHAETDASPDPHIWLNPLNMQRMANNLLAAIIKLDPSHQLTYQKNYQLFSLRMQRLHQKIQSALTTSKHKAFMVFHPSWGYFAQQYGLKQIAIEYQGRQPTAQSLIQLISLAKQYKIRHIFIQKAFSKKAADFIAQAIHAKIIVVDPLSEQYEEALWSMVSKMQNSHE